MKSARVGVVVACALVLGASAGLAQPRVSTPEEEARLQECILNGDNRCVIALLDGRALDLPRARALFTAQRDVGDRAGACRTARALVEMEGVPAAQRSMLRRYVETQCEPAEAR